MKPFISLLLILILSFPTASLNAQLRQTDLQKAGLKGKVKKVISVIGILSPKEENYNEQGNLVSETEAYMDESVKRELSYNTKGLKTEEKEINSNGKIERRAITKYDAKNNPISETSFNQYGKTEFLTSYVNMYNKKGMLTQVTEKTVFYDEKGKVRDMWTLLTKYDETGKMIEQTRRDKAGKIIFQQTRKYDSRGTMIENTEKNEWKKTITKSFPQYNEDGRIEELISYITNSNGGKTDTILQKNFYENQKLSKKITNNAGTIWTELYNENEYLLSQQIGDDLYITFKYDEHGNWIEQVSTNSNKVFGTPKVVESFREIEYY